MDADRSCGATFEPDRTLTVSPRPSHGYVTGTGIDCGSGDRDDCAETVAHGAEATLTATAEATYELRNWGGACTGTGPCAVTLTADATVSATFGKVQRTLTVSPEPTGGNVAGGGIDCGSTGDTCQATTDTGTSATLTATPDDGYELTAWTGRVRVHGHGLPMRRGARRRHHCRDDLRREGMPRRGADMDGGRQRVQRLGDGGVQRVDGAGDGQRLPDDRIGDVRVHARGVGRRAGADLQPRLRGGDDRRLRAGRRRRTAGHRGPARRRGRVRTPATTAPGTPWVPPTAARTTRTAAGTYRSWTIGGKSCSSTMSNAAHGGSSTATDSTHDLTGKRDVLVRRRGMAAPSGRDVRPELRGGDDRQLHLGPRGPWRRIRPLFNRFVRHLHVRVL